MTHLRLLLEVRRVHCVYFDGLAAALARKQLHMTVVAVMMLLMMMMMIMMIMMMMMMIMMLLLMMMMTMMTNLHVTV